MPADAMLLAQIPFFALLDEQQRGTLAELIDTTFIPRGTVLFRRGDAGESLYAIRSGRIEVFVESHDGERIVLNTSGPGELLGEISLLDGGPRTASAVTLEDCEVLVMNRDDLVELVGRHPHAAIAMLTVVGQRLRSTDAFLRDHVSRNPNLEEEGQMSQNRQAYKDRLKSDIEYEVNIKAEHEIAHLHRKIDRLYEEVQAHFAQVKKAVGGRP